MYLHAKSDYLERFFLVNKLAHNDFHFWSNVHFNSCKLVKFVSHRFIKAYSMLSARACSDAVMMFSLTPTVPHSCFASLVVINTRVFAAVPVALSMIRTL